MIVHDQRAERLPIVVRCHMAQFQCRAHADPLAKSHLNYGGLLVETIQRQTSDESVGRKRISMNDPPIAMRQMLPERAEHILDLGLGRRRNGVRMVRVPNIRMRSVDDDPSVGQRNYAVPKPSMPTIRVDDGVQVGHPESVSTIAIDVRNWGGTGRSARGRRIEKRTFVRRLPRQPLSPNCQHHPASASRQSSTRQNVPIHMSKLVAVCSSFQGHGHRTRWQRLLGRPRTRPCPAARLRHRDRLLSALSESAHENGPPVARRPAIYSVIVQAVSALRRRIAKPVMPNPAIIRAQVAGSGTAVPNTFSSSRP